MADDLAAGAANLDIQDQILSKVDGTSGRSRGGKKGGRGGGRGLGGGGSRSSDVSRALSRLLRHQAENAGIKLDSEGYASLDKVVRKNYIFKKKKGFKITTDMQLQWGALKSLGVTLADVQDVVATNEKQRFTLKPKTPDATSTAASDYLIRANQGHSIKIESSSLLVPITVEAGNIPPRVLHGTYYGLWEAIVESGGLKTMGRNHIHCSSGTPEEGVVSGMRKDAQLLIEIDVEASMQEGITWWLSDNGVVLTEGDKEGVLASRFFRRVEGRKAEVGLLWENGVVVAGLPEGINKAVPSNKGPRGGGRGRGRGGRGRGGSSRGKE